MPSRKINFQIVNSKHWHIVAETDFLEKYIDYFKSSSSLPDFQAINNFISLFLREGSDIYFY